MLARITGTLESIADTVAVVAPAGQDGLAYQVLVPAYLAGRFAGIETGQPLTGATVTLHTLQYFESLNQGASFIPRLVGFSSPKEREFFELLTSVKGLGNKRALRAMAMEPASIARAIAERDARYLQSLPEIGPKLAELIVHELKGKVDRFLLDLAELETLDAHAAGAAPVPAAPHANGSLNGAKGHAPSAQLAIEPKPKGRKAPASAPSSPRHPATPPPPQSPRPPIRQTVDALIALGESPTDAERMVHRAIERTRASGQPVPTTTDELLTAAYNAR
jgi:Holliday junction DNA helicase RuvA